VQLLFVVQVFRLPFATCVIFSQEQALLLVHVVGQLLVCSRVELLRLVAVRLIFLFGFQAKAYGRGVRLFCNAVLLSSILDVCYGMRGGVVACAALAMGPLLRVVLRTRSDVKQ
jgi:hypothetical protein